MTLSLAYTVKSRKDFQQVVENIRSKVKERGFRVIMVHDMQAILLVRQFKIQPFKILEICHAAHDYEIVKAQPELGLMMPCKILVRVENGQTLISGMRLSVLEPYLDNANVASVFGGIDRDIRTIIDESK